VDEENETTALHPSSPSDVKGMSSPGGSESKHSGGERSSEGDERSSDTIKHPIHGIPREPGCSSVSTNGNNASAPSVLRRSGRSKRGSKKGAPPTPPLVSRTPAASPGANNNSQGDGDSQTSFSRTSSTCGYRDSFGKAFYAISTGTELLFATAI